MRSQTWLIKIACVLLALTGLAVIPAHGKDKKKESKEQKKARKAAEKATKKSSKRLLKAMKALQRAKNDDAREQIREKCIEFVREFENINHYVAADFIINWAPNCADEEVYSVARDALASMNTEEVADHLTERFKETKNKKLRVDWRQKIMILDAFKDNNAASTNEATVLGLSDSNPAVRRSAVAIAGRKESKDVISALIEVLKAVDKRGGLFYFQVRQALVDLTGEDFFTHDKWTGWWQSKKDSFDFSQKGEKKEAGTVERKAEEVPKFFGTEIKSSSCLFIIDISGSMRMTDPPESYDKGITEYQKTAPDPKRQRIERAKAALLKVIKTLQPTQQFNIIRYSSAVNSWQKKDQLVPATDGNKQAASAFIEAIKEGGGTETFQALQRAYKAYPNIDTIYLLSDGAPSPGKLGNPGEQQQGFERAEIKKIINWVKQNNRFRRIKIHTFGFAGPGAWHKKWGPRSVTLPTDPKYISHFAEFMQELAAVTQGDYNPLS